MKSKISYKLIVAVGGVTIAILSALSYFMIKSQQQALIHQIDETAHQISETIKSSTKYDMLLNQRQHIHRIIEKIGEQPGIEKIRIFNKQGEIIYSTDENEFGHLVDKRAESCYACHAIDQPLERLPIPDRTRTFTTNHQKKLGVINPIYNEPGCWQASCHAHDKSQTVLGVLDVTMSLHEVEEQISSNRSKMIMFAASAIIVISLLLWFLVHRLIGKPVARLVNATKEVANGNIEHKVSEIKNDELGLLGTSFNEMTSKLATAQRQLYQSDQLASLGRLAAGLAHEINNPLTGVLTYSSILLKNKDLTPEVKDDLNVIVNESKRCREIVKRLLDFARPVPSEKARIAMADVIAKTLGIFENQFKKKRISLKTELQENLPQVYADPNQLQQVLVNLIVNAADAIGENGGSITISTSKEVVSGGEYIYLKVKDTGSGISEKTMSKIFEPFFTTKGQKGTGLGLSVVWGIMEEHGGKIDVQSEPGKGTTFILKFPAVGASAILQKETENQPAALI